MVTLRKRFWTERSRILALMLAVLVPAAALILVSFLHLRSIQRDGAVEAAIQRDYQQVLAIAEKQIGKRAYELAENARQDFPDIDHIDALPDFLATHPGIAHAFVFDKRSGIEFYSQPERMRDPQFHAESDQLSTMFDKWFDIEAKQLVGKVKKVHEKGITDGT